MTWQENLTKAEAKKLERLRLQRDKKAEEYNAYRKSVKNAAEHRARRLQRETKDASDD